MDWNPIAGLRELHLSSPQMNRQGVRLGLRLPFPCGNFLFSLPAILISGQQQETLSICTLSLFGTGKLQLQQDLTRHWCKQRQSTAVVTTTKRLWGCLAAKVSRLAQVNSKKQESGGTARIFNAK